MLKVKKVLMLGLVFAAYGAQSNDSSKDDARKKALQVLFGLNASVLTVSVYKSLPIFKNFSHGTPSQKAAAAFAFIYFNAANMIAPVFLSWSIWDGNGNQSREGS